MAIRPSRKRPVRFRAGVKRLTQSFRSRQHPTTVAITEDLRSQFEKIERRLATVINTMEEATPDALEHALQPIIANSNIYVPLNTKQLPFSIYLKALQTIHGAVAEFGFGASGPSVGYAVIVHENLEFRHESPTKARFLADAIDEHVGEVIPRLQDFMRLV